VSTSTTIYNLTDETCFYLDHSYWLLIDRERLTSRGNLSVDVASNIRYHEDNDRALAWLGSLQKWIWDGSQGSVYLAIDDTSDIDLQIPLLKKFDKFEG
jgi:hypothetical protein